MLCQECAVAEMHVSNVTQQEIALHELSMVSARKAGYSAAEIYYGRDEVKPKKEESQRARRNRDSNEADKIRTRVMEFSREYDKLMLLAKAAQQREMALPDWI